MSFLWKMGTLSSVKNYRLTILSLIMENRIKLQQQTRFSRENCNCYCKLIKIEKVTTTVEE